MKTVCKVCGGPTTSKIGICHLTPRCIAEYHRTHHAVSRGGEYTPRRSCVKCGSSLRTNNKGQYCMTNLECKRLHWAEAHGWQVYDSEGVVARVSEWRKTKPDKYALQRAKIRAKKFGVPFDLTLADLPPVPEFCPALGIPVYFNLDRASWNSLSLDRIIPELGYIPGNVQWLSKKANLMKANATPEELKMFAEWILK